VSLLFKLNAFPHSLNIWQQRCRGEMRSETPFLWGASNVGGNEKTTSTFFHLSKSTHIWTWCKCMCILCIIYRHTQHLYLMAVKEREREECITEFSNLQQYAHTCANKLNSVCGMFFLLYEWVCEILHICL